MTSEREKERKLLEALYTQLITSCEVCGKLTSQSSGRCTNGRCGECHRQHCTTGGEHGPGHGRGNPPRQLTPSQQPTGDH
jgi:hypothetical protein